MRVDSPIRWTFIGDQNPTIQKKKHENRSSGSQEKRGTDGREDSFPILEVLKLIDQSKSAYRKYYTIAILPLPSVGK